MSQQPKTEGGGAGGRLAFLDWMRGLAVVSMLNGHVFHSFTRPDLRDKGPYMFSQLFGGIGPAVFLFLTGITLAFLMDRRERQGVAPTTRWIAALRRAGYLLLLAFLFRIQGWIFGYPSSPTPELLKVDILNCMGFSIGLLTATAFLRTATRVKVGALLGVAIAALGPVVSSLDWSWLPQPIAAYIVPNYNAFAFFPWAAFIAFGLSAGSLLRLVSHDQIHRIMQWATLAGLTLIVTAQYFSAYSISIYQKSEFWLNSPGLIFIKLGIVLLIASFSYLWSEYVVGAKWSPLRQFGITSLLVYWLHVELVYGRWFGYWKDRLTNWQCVLAAAVLILFMLGLSVVRTNWRTIAERLKLPFSPLPTRDTRPPGAETPPLRAPWPATALYDKPASKY